MFIVHIQDDRRPTGLPKGMILTGIPTAIGDA